MTTFGHQMKSHVLVTYGSQTGHGESVAFDIACGLFQKGIPCYLCNISELTFYMKRDVQLFNSTVKEHLLIVLVLSTTGQGEPTDSTREFWNLLFSSESSKISFGDWHFAVFGLGDSRYKEFNIVARKVRLRLNQLGGTEFYRVGLGDDKHAYGYEAEFDPWFTGFLNNLKLRNGTCSSDMSQFSLLPAKYNVIKKTCGVDERISFLKNETCMKRNLKSCLFQAQVIENKLMTHEDHFQKVNYLCLKIPARKSFSPGSCLSIYPKADKNVVEHFILHVLHRELNEVVVVEKSEMYPFVSFPYSFRNARLHEFQKHFLHQEITLVELFTNYLDISYIPTRSTLHVLAHFTTTLLYREKLLQLCEKNAEGRQFYYEFIKAEHRSIAQVLWDFNECVTEMPLEHLLSLFPTIVPRRYSIASAPYWYSSSTWCILQDNFAVRKFPILLGHRAPLVYSSLQNSRKSFECQLSALNTFTHQVTQTCKKNLLTYLKEWSYENNQYQYIDLCVALVIKKTPFLRQVEGLCSSYLCRLKIGDTLLCELEETSFFPLKPLMTLPLFIVSTGTGIAPIRSVLQARFLKAACKNHLVSPFKALNPILCFFGYRHPEKDFLFRDDFHEMCSSMVSLPNPTVYPCFNPFNYLNISTIIAFSQENQNKKLYVQDAFMHYSSKVKSMFCDKKGYDDLMILICGRSHPMPLQVTQYLIDLLSVKGNSRKTFERMLKEKKKNQRLVFETWGA